jgi:hypothetical protein
MMVPTKTSGPRGTDMLTPMLQALPIAVPIALAAIAVGGYAAQRYVDHMPFLPVWATRRPTAARHRMTPAAAADPARRDSAAVAAERLNGFPLPAAAAEPEQPKTVYGLLDPEVPLAEVEEYLRNIGISDWYQPLIDFEGPTREMAVLQ